MTNTSSSMPWCKVARLRRLWVCALGALICIELVAVGVLGRTILASWDSDPKILEPYRESENTNFAYLARIDSLQAQVPDDFNLLPAWTRLAEMHRLRVVNAVLNRPDSADGLMGRVLTLRVEGEFARVGRFCAAMEKLRPVVQISLEGIERDEERTVSSIKITQWTDRT